MRPLLYIGDKKLSSWSLRPWLALAVPGLPFDEEVVRLDRPDTKVNILRFSPNGKVPCLVHGAATIWESLAICEYVAETWPEAKLWPIDPVQRAKARALSSEMHAGFAALRKECPMHVLEERPGRDLSEQCQKDIRRVFDIWEDAKGPFLFGEFSIADAMYAPVVTRFTTYQIEVPAFARRYMDTIWALPAMQRWKEGAQRER